MNLFLSWILAVGIDEDMLVRVEVDRVGLLVGVVKIGAGMDICNNVEGLMCGVDCPSKDDTVVRGVDSCNGLYGVLGSCRLVCQWVSGTGLVRSMSL